MSFVKGAGITPPTVGTRNVVSDVNVGARVTLSVDGARITPPTVGTRNAVSDVNVGARVTLSVDGRFIDSGVKLVAGLAINEGVVGSVVTSGVVTVVLVTVSAVVVGAACVYTDVYASQCECGQYIICVNL